MDSRVSTLSLLLKVVWSDMLLIFTNEYCPIYVLPIQFQSNTFYFPGAQNVIKSISNMEQQGTQKTRHPEVVSQPSLSS